MIRWPGRQKAVEMRRRHMNEAREAMTAYWATRDPIYRDIAHVHVRTAWAFSRHVWRHRQRRQ